MKGKLIQKLCAVSLSVLMLTGASVAEIGSFVGTSLPVSAATAETPASSFEYEINDEGGITITKFTGSETEVTIPSKIDGKSVTEIGNRVFEDCTDLTSITIPNSVRRIGWHVFWGCTGLKSIVVRSANPSYSSKNGVLFNKNKTGLIAFPGGKTGSYSIPDSVTKICGDAFSGCTGLTGITIPDSVTKICGDAFSDCTGLKSVTIPNSVTEIYFGAFEGCTGLTSIVVRSANPSYSSKNGVLFNKNKTELIAFPGGKTGSYSIPDSVTKIRGYAFYRCTGLTGITIPNGVTIIDEFTFQDCTGLKSVTIPNSVTEIYTGAFQSCSSLTSITIPNSVTYIGSGAFAFCSGLTSLTIPDSVTEISNNAFSGCTNLTIKGKKGSYAETYANVYGIPFVADEEEVKNTSTVSAKAITKGSSVTVNCASTGGSGSFQYAVFYKQKTQTKWTCTQSYKTNKTVTITPKAATSYTIRVKAKDTVTGKVVNKDFTVKVNAPLKNTSAISAQTVTKGSSVTVSCGSTGGQGNTQYAVYYKQQSQTKWTCAQSYKANKTVTITPKAATTYNIRVKAKDASGKIVNKDFTVTVTK